MTRRSIWQVSAPAVNVLRGVALGSVVGCLCGLASAAFLAALEWVTDFRTDNTLIVFALPLAGLGIGLVYGRLGKDIAPGTNLILETANDPARPAIPLRMAPMVLVGTVLTHLFGGSAGREGTAVQMGASLADGVARTFHLQGRLRSELLVAGMAGGFGSVFGTPVAGLVFGLEVIVIGRLSYAAILPAAFAALVGDMVTHATGMAHVPYPTVAKLGLTPLVLAKWVLFGLVMAAVVVVFIRLTAGLKATLTRFIPALPLRMASGGLLVVLMWQLAQTDDYLGLGIPTLVRAFSDPDLASNAFALKLIFTAVTLSAGFLGGEVTPLFFIGAALGNVFGRWLGLPLDLAAGVGMAAAFATASNTPIALSIMAVELLGSAVLPHVVIVSVVAFIVSGNHSIFHAHRLAQPKHGHQRFDEPIPLAQLAKRDGSQPS